MKRRAEQLAQPALGARARRRSTCVAPVCCAEPLDRRRPARRRRRRVVATVFTIGGRHSPSAHVCSDSMRFDRRRRAVGAFAIGLVDDEDVGDLHDAGLERLHVVAGARHQRDDRDVGGADDVDFVLADADGLDDDDVLAGGVEDERRVAGRARQAAQVAARRHAADEHARVAGVRLHAHAVAEDRAAA